MRLLELSGLYQRLIKRTCDALEGRGIHTIFVADRQAALTTVLQLMPLGTTVAHSTSTILKEIGLIGYLQLPGCPYQYLNSEWQREADSERRGRLQARLSLEAHYFLGSVQAICQSGEIISADASGCIQAAYVFGPPHIIWVAGLNKLVPSLEIGLRTVHEQLPALEDQPVKRRGPEIDAIGKLVIHEHERPGRTTLILVGESLGG